MFELNDDDLCRVAGQKQDVRYRSILRRPSTFAVPQARPARGSAANQFNQTQTSLQHFNERFFPHKFGCRLTKI